MELARTVFGVALIILWAVLTLKHRKKWKRIAKYCFFCVAGGLGIGSIIIALLSGFARGLIERLKGKSKKRVERYPRRQKYITKYIRERLRKDPEFRERFKTHVRKSAKRRYERIREFQSKYPEYDEVIRKYYRECRHDGKTAWKRRKGRIAKLRRKMGIDFPLCWV